MLHWFKDLMKVTKKLQSIDPKFRLSCSLVPSSGCSEITNFVCDFIDNKKWTHPQETGGIIPTLYSLFHYLPLVETSHWNLSKNLILQTWWDWWIWSADATSCNTRLIVLFSTDQSSMPHWSYFRIKILMTECHESFSFQLKKFWHDRVPPLKVLKSMWTQTAAILVKYSWKGREVALSKSRILQAPGAEK